MDFLFFEKMPKQVSEGKGHLCRPRWVRPVESPGRTFYELAERETLQALNFDGRQWKCVGGKIIEECACAYAAGT